MLDPTIPPPMTTTSAVSIIVRSAVQSGTDFSLSAGNSCRGQTKVCPTFFYRRVFQDLFLRSLLRVKFRNEASAAHHQNPIRHSQKFWQVGRDHYDGRARFGKLIDLAINFRPRRHVNAARRFVEQEDLRVSEEPPREQRLLLVASAQASHRFCGGRRSDAQLAYENVGGVEFGLAPQSPASDERADVGQRDVGRERQVQTQARTLAIFGQQAQTARDRAGRLRGGNLFGAEFDLAAFGRLRAEDRFDQLGPPRPGEPRDADDLARARFKTHILELRRAGQPCHTQFDLADAARSRREYLFQFATGHVPDHLVGAYLAPRPRVNGPPVAQYGQPVGDLRQFFQTVRNIDDGKAS